MVHFRFCAVSGRERSAGAKVRVKRHRRKTNFPALGTERSFAAGADVAPQTKSPLVTISLRGRRRDAMTRDEVYDVAIAAVGQQERAQRFIWLSGHECIACGTEEVSASKTLCGDSSPEGIVIERSVSSRASLLLKAPLDRDDLLLAARQQKLRSKSLVRKRSRRDRSQPCRMDRLLLEGQSCSFTVFGGGASCRANSRSTPGLPNADQAQR